MAWHHGIFSCGHEGRVNITGPTKNRDYIAERKFEGKCSECYEIYIQEQKEKANVEALAKAKEMELPELIGSEKQATWATTIRQKFIEKVESKLENIKEGTGDKNLANTVFNFILTNKVEAKWFIDNRFDFEDIEGLFKRIKDEIKTDEQIIESKTEIEIKAECTVYPINKVTEAIAEIETKDDRVSVKFEKNDAFREIVKALGYSWTGVWEKTIKETTGTSSERAAELGNKLLNEGFPIMILDEDTRNKAIKGEYEKEYTRWIYKRKDSNLLAIRWQGMNDKLYKVSKSIPGAFWDSGSMVLKVVHYKEVIDFANLYEFKFTTGALKAIEEHKNICETIPIVKPTKIEEIKPIDGLQKILNSSTDILDDLREDD